MKVSATAALFGGLGLLVAVPVYAQRGGHGGFSGHMGSSGRGGAPRGSGGGRVRSMSPPAGAHFHRVGTPVRVIRTPVRVSGQASAPPVVILRGSFGATPAQHIVLRRPIGEMRPVPVHPVFVDHQFARLRFHRFHRGFGFPFCSPVFGIGFATHHFGFFHHELACFPHPFFSPFFFPFAPVAGSTFLVLPSSVVGQEPLAEEQQMEEVPAGEPTGEAESQPAGEPSASSQQGSRRLTLLQLKNGSMYGLTDYWLEDGRLHYITSYGGENSVPIEEIDFDKTVQLNSESGVEFVLRPKPSTR